jgi:hypothetical protein
VWETPFSPTNISFPCTIGRPEGISDEQAKKMMYVANHNLNAEIAIGGMSLLVPNLAQLNQTNAVEGQGSLGLMATECAGTYLSLWFRVCLMGTDDMLQTSGDVRQIS